MLLPTIAESAHWSERCNPSGLTRRLCPHKGSSPRRPHLADMGSVLSSDRDHKEDPKEDPNASYDCAVCLEVLNRPTRTRCGHVFCYSCIKASLSNNADACPYCRAPLCTAGTLAVDIMKKMKTVFQNCEGCEEKICLSEMRAHLNKCQPYISKYGPLVELGKIACREETYVCPFCPEELEEDELVHHCFIFHPSESRLVTCPICRLRPGGDSSYNSSFHKHLQTRHSIYYENYIDINIVEEAIIERVIDLSLIHFMSPSDTS
ncbi:E3 ubiquitin-protein ligase RNF125 [Ranitomeya imitator]|uniref:E3 ubiquitin-protein ligase RNF125 n=1 Tax=Ranitomeya imitator TaxID=111125 RepID=UPI0037E76FED